MKYIEITRIPTLKSIDMKTISYNGIHSHRINMKQEYVRKKVSMQQDIYNENTHP